MTSISCGNDLAKMNNEGLCLLDAPNSPLTNYFMDYPNDLGRRQLLNFESATTCYLPVVQEVIAVVDISSPINGPVQS